MKALVLSGGGARGAFQAGVLRRWVEEYPELDYDLFIGTSAGAINASVLANLSSNMTFRDAVLALEDFWRNGVRENDDVYRFWPGFIPMFWKDAVYDTGPLQRILKRYLVGASKPCWVSATNVSTGQLEYFDEKRDDFWKCVLASASFPIFFPIVKIDGSEYSDGAQIHNIPVGHAIRQGAKSVHVIASNDPYTTVAWNKKRTVFSLIRRTLDIMTEQMTKSDIEITGFKNDLSDLSPAWKKVIVQTIFFNGSSKYDALDFDGLYIDEMIDAGYTQAMRAVVVD